MPKIDVTDEALIDSSPMEVYKAILNEVAGVTQWWMPDIEFKLRGDVPTVCEGAVVDVTLNPEGRIKCKFSGKYTKVVEAKLIEEEYTGDWVGTGTFIFEPTDGKTKLQFRFNAKSNRLLFSLVSPFVNMGKMHSDMIQKGFKSLNSYLSKK